MGLLNSALQIGRSAILSYGGALQAVGNNISGAGNPDHTRLTPELASMQGPSLGRGLQPGAGVVLTDIQRNIDEALEQRLRLAIGAEQATFVRQGGAAELEALFNDLSGAGVGTRLTEFFHGFDEVQNTPEDTATRDLTISSGRLLGESLQRLRSNIASLGEDIDRQITGIVVRADEIAREIARLNSQITSAETSQRGQATALRDQRDALLRELSEYFDVDVREQPDGSFNVYVGSETLVQADRSRGLITVTNSDGEFTRTSVRFADTNQQIVPQTGRIAGLIASRDNIINGRLAVLDELAAALISEVNRIHADGQGLVAFRSVVGTYDLLETDVALSASESGLSSEVSNGSFYITVTDDATGTPVAHRIDVDAGDGGTTLESFVEQINTNVDGVTASITGDNRLAMVADDGFAFSFGHDGQEPRADTSGVLAALGINTFFTGTNAADIGVNEALEDDPFLLAAASVFLPGDGTNAGRIAGLDTGISSQLNGVSISNFYQSVANAIAVEGSSSLADADSAATVLSSLKAQRESISGVNLDEEAVALLKFQRAFQGAARFVSVVDDLMSELIALIR